MRSGTPATAASRRPRIATSALSASTPKSANVSRPAIRTERPSLSSTVRVSVTAADHASVVSPRQARSGALVAERRRSAASAVHGVAAISAARRAAEAHSQPCRVGMCSVAPFCRPAYRPHDVGDWLMTLHHRGRRERARPAWRKGHNGSCQIGDLRQNRVGRSTSYGVSGTP